MNARRLMVAWIAVAVILLVGCTPKADSTEGVEATSASALVQVCEMIGDTTAHVQIKVVGRSEFTYLKVSFRVEDRAVPGKQRGGRTLNAEYVEDGYIGNTDVQVGEASIQPVCVITDVTGPEGEPL